jgi:hypothetical protein
MSSHMVDPAPCRGGRSRARGGDSCLLVLEGADHKDTVLALGDPGSRLAATVLEMIGRN